MSSFPWESHYPKGVRSTVNYDENKTLLDLFEESLKKYKDRVAFENMGKQLTYGEIDKLSTLFAAYLQGLGTLREGDCIALQMPNMLQYPVALIGAFKAGMTVVNTNPLYTSREMKHQFCDAEVKAIVILENFAHNLEKIISDTQIETIIVTRLGDMLGSLKGAIVNFVVKNIKKMVPDFQLPGVVTFKQAMKEGAKRNYRRPEVKDSSEVAFFQYTGGTTGVSKGAMLSHKNIVAHTAQLTEWFGPLLKDNEAELIVTAIPLYHVFALSVNGIFMMSIGAKNLLITNPRDMDGFIKELKKQSFTILTGVNTLFNGLMNHAAFKSLDFSKLKITVGGGMAVQDFTANKWKEVTGSPLAQGYGLSETSPVLSCNPLDGSERLGSIGLPVPNTELRIYSEEGKVLSTGEIGEICGKGPQVMSGYWNQSNEGVFFDDVWFKTGDMGLMDEDGFFRIVDRKKDMINVSGFNVYPNEVENVIAEHPKVLEVAAIGVPDKKSTEAVKVFVVKADDSLSESELSAFCVENMTGYKKPKYIEFRKDLPKSNVGKILRRLLKEEEITKSERQ